MSNERMQSSFLGRLGLALSKTLRFLFLLAIIAGLAALIYFGTPYVYERVISPLDANTERIADIAAKQTADVEELSTQSGELKDRLTELENRQTESAQLIASLGGQVSALEDTLEKHSITLKQLDDMQESIDALLETSAEYEEVLTGKNSVIAELRQEVMLSRAIELLSRGRLYLAQSNFGLAKEDIKATRDLLAEMQPEIAKEKSATFQNVIDRLDQAIKNLPDFPIVAVDDIDAAWQLLVSGLPEEFEALPTPIVEEAEPTTNE